VYEHRGRPIPEQPVVELDSVDRKPPELHPVSLAADGTCIAGGTRYRLAMARRPTRSDAADAISRAADSGGDAVRNLVVLPLRMLIGTLDFIETQLQKASDTLREIDPLDERVVRLEERVESLETQRTGRSEATRTATEKSRKAPVAQREPAAHSSGRGENEPSSDTTAAVDGES
jgi:hypothetical protein